MIGTYAAVIGTYVRYIIGKIEALMCSLPVILLGLASMLSTLRTLPSTIHRMYSTPMMIPPLRLLQVNYPSTILGIQCNDSTVIISRDSMDTYNNSDCADTLLQFQRYPLAIRWIPFDNSTNNLWWFCGYPLTILRISSKIPRINCGLLMQWICRFSQVSCDVYRMCRNLAYLDYYVLASTLSFHMRWKKGRTSNRLCSYSPGKEL